MKTFEHLPTEIQIEIFSFVNRKADLFECLLTCKLWHVLSNQVFYGNIEFNNENIEKADGFGETLNKHGKDIKCLVKHIKIACSRRYEEQYQTLLKFFADECLNVRTVTLCGKVEDLFYQKELHHKNWKHLEKFHIESLGVSKSAVTIANQHQGTIKEFEFHESDGPILCDEKRNKQKVNEKLAKFMSLEKLSITIECPRHLSSLDNMIPENVKSLTLRLRSFLPTQDTTIPYDTDLSKIIPCPNIRELTLHIPLSDDNSIKYLVLKFPNLEKLSCSNSEIIPVPENTRKVFTDYLLNIKNVNFTYTLVCNSDGPKDYFLVRKLIESSKINSSKKQRNFIVCIQTSHSFISELEVKRGSGNGVESYKVTVSLKESQKLDFLKNFGAYLTGLKIIKTKNDELDLSQIFKHCPNLNSLDVRGFDVTLGDELKENTMNLETLNYAHSKCFTSEILSEWFRYFPNLIDLTFSGSKGTAIDFSSIITAFPSLKCLKITNAELSLFNTDKENSTIKMLNLNMCKFSSSGFFSDLSRCLPNVNDLKLCISGDSLKSDEFILNMPETSFQDLSMYVDYNGSKQPTFLLKVSLPVNDKEADNNKRYYLSEKYYTGMAKKHTEAEYESVVSESAKDSRVFLLVVNCKEFPMAVKLSVSSSEIDLRAGTCVC